MYDPKIESYISKTAEDWGDPEENRRRRILYKVGPAFDQAMWGLPVGYESELIAIQGPIKNRKSTFLANLILNFAAQLMSNEHPWWICIDSLESGMTPKSYRDVMIAMVATRMMIATEYGQDRTQWPDASQIIQHPNLYENLVLSRKFFREQKPNDFQKYYIDQAKDYIAQLPISMFGAPADQGKARDLEYSVDRWQRLYDGEYENCTDRNHRIIAIDHIQQYGRGGGDYSNLEKATTTISDFAASNTGTVFLVLSQVSLGSIREASAGGKLVAKGGEKLAAEANIVFNVRYDRERNPLVIEIATSEGRDDTPPTMVQQIQPTSGVALKFAEPKVERRYG